MVREGTVKEMYFALRVEGYKVCTGLQCRLEFRSTINSYIWIVSACLAG